MARISRRQFEAWIAAAVTALPKKFRDRLDNVALVLEDDAPSRRYLGLYRGVPHPYRGPSYSGVLPDKITIYAKAMVREAKNSRELPGLVRRVVWHEVGHHFGLTDRELEQLDRRWKSRWQKSRQRKT